METATQLLPIETLRPLSPEELLVKIEQSSLQAGIVTAFGNAGMVLLDMVSRVAPSLNVYTINTGMLPKETHELIRKVKDQYKLNITVVGPNPMRVAAYIDENGLDGFMDSVEQRKDCCYLRKVEPLERILKGLDVYFTGVRRADSDERTHTPKVLYEEERQIIKINPLVDWSNQQLTTYMEEHDVPHNELFDMGYTSIGCSPCTRPTLPGESPRAGRWSWENGNTKECGLHLPMLR